MGVVWYSNLEPVSDMQGAQANSFDVHLALYLSQFNRLTEIEFVNLQVVLITNYIVNIQQYIPAWE